ncbi:MAG: hypothetical protein UZ14_CFX002000411 [Chloroflexi bacterium OLB14]|nr:MAG: hypothetical protein UZ14_CFX002000411 [Chloroflexi bacterium OLB14]
MREIEPSKRARVRMQLLAVIIATIPCYCTGLIALSFAPNPRATPTPTITITHTGTITPATPHRVALRHKS